MGRRWRRRPADERGFALLESMIAIVLIAIVMTALTTLFVTSMKATVHQRASQSAIQIATDEVDQVRAIGYSGALSGRDQASVATQFTAASTQAQAWLATAADQAYDGDAPDGTGHTPCVGGATTGCALLPTVGVTRTLGTTDFTLNYYAEWCYRAGDITGADTDVADCLPADQSDVDKDVQYLRVVVDITWPDRECAADTCHYVSSVLLNGKSEPTFYFNSEPPPKPNLTTCAPLAIAVGDTFDDSLPGDTAVTTDDHGHLISPAAPILEPAVNCALDGGVPQFTWEGHNLPAGLSVLGSGFVIGTVAPGATTVTDATFTVTDAFIISDTSDPFTWQVLPELTVSEIEPQQGWVGTGVDLTVTATGGQGPDYTWDVTGLPDGVTGTPAGSGDHQLKLAGSPTTAGEYQVTIGVSDSASPVKRRTTTTVDWIVYDPLEIADVGDQSSTTGDAVDDLTIGVTGGSGTYTLTADGLPDGVSLQGDSDAGYHLEGTTASAGSYTVTLTATDEVPGGEATGSFTWTVTDPPPTTTPDPPTAPPSGAP